MYFSEVRLNPDRITTRRMIGSPQVTHALVEGAVTETAEGRSLWRLDRRGGDLLLYVVSRNEPDFASMVDQSGWPESRTWRTARYQPLLDRLRAGQQWIFALTANPCRAEARPGARGQVRPLRTASQQVDWLMTRQQRLGVTFPGNTTGASQVEITERRLLRFNRNGAEKGQGKRVELTTASFQGLLEIVDPELLRMALVDGVGRAKGYGCGLMTLAPVK